MLNVIIKSIVLTVATLSAGIALRKEAKRSKTLPKSTQNTYIQAPAIDDVGYAQIETNTRLKKHTTDHQGFRS